MECACFGRLFLLTAFAAGSLECACERKKCLNRSLLLDLQLHLVVDRVGAVLLVLSGWRLARDHLHLHRSRQKQLLLILLLLLLLVLQRVAALVGRARLLCHHVVLHSLGRAALVVGDA